MPLGTMTPATAARAANLDALAARFAVLTLDDAETLIDRYVDEAIAQWRVADATFWQRVKFRARLLRAARRHANYLPPRGASPAIQPAARAPHRGNA